MAKKGKSPRKFRQARAAAKPAAKAAFPGKVKAYRKDITGKLSAEDRMALKEMSDTAKKELGKKAYLSKADYEATQKAAREKFRESMREEGLYPEKKNAPAKKAAAKKAAVKKPAGMTPRQEAALQRSVKKEDRRMAKLRAADPAKFDAREKIATDSKLTAKQKFKAIEKVGKTAKPKPAEPAKSGKYLEMQEAKKMTRAEKSAANKAKWKSMTPAERKNWSASKAAAPKPAPNVSKATTPAAKRVTLADLKKNEAKGLQEAKARVAAKNQALANSAKGKTQTPTAAKAKATAKPEGKAPVKKAAAPKKYAKTRGLIKGGAAAAVAGEAVSMLKGSTAKDAKEINRLRAKLAAAKGQKSPGALSRLKEGLGSEVGQLAYLASGTFVGKSRRQRMDELNKQIAKASKTKQLRYGKDGSSLVPGTKAYKAGSKTKPAYTKTTQPTGGGSTTKISGTYTVKKGDTLSGIAKQAGVSLSDIRSANPKFMKNKKYKQGSMIWSGTKVKLPKK